MEPLYNGSLSDSIGPLITSFKPESIYGDETKFAELKQAAISELREMILGMINTQDPDNFRKILTKAGELRGRIALATGTDEAKLFGSPRISGDYLSTLLSTERYQEANQKIKELVLSCLALLPDKTKTRRKFTENSRYTFKLLKENDLLFASPFTLFEKMMNGKHSEADESSFALSHLIDHKQKILPILYTLEGKTFNKASIAQDQNMYVFVGRIELKTDNEWRTLTRHFTVLKCDDKGEIDEDHFKLHGIVALLHTNYRDIKLHDAPMAHLFNQILNSPADLTELMREFEYRQHHLCYFIRGSATSTELIQEALKSALHPQYALKTDLEALREPFLNTYLKG